MLRLVPGDVEAQPTGFGTVLEALPRERFPRTIEAAGPISNCDDPDAYYELGLEILLAGIVTLARRRSG